MKAYFTALIVTCAILCMLLSSVQAQPFVIKSPFCPVRINEVMPNPTSGTDDGREFIELWNYGDDWEDIGSWTLTDGEDSDNIDDYTGAYDIGIEGTEIPPGGYALIVEGDYTGNYNEYLEDYAGVNNFILVKVNDNQIGNVLSDSSDSVTITTDWLNHFPFGGTYQTKTYSWTSATQGVSIERDRYDTSTWMDSPDPEYGYTPGGINSYN